MGAVGPYVRTWVLVHPNPIFSAFPPSTSPSSSRIPYPFPPSGRFAGSGSNKVSGGDGFLVCSRAVCLGCQLGDWAGKLKSILVSPTLCVYAFGGSPSFFLGW
jgi:hypothetical protein